MAHWAEIDENNIVVRVTVGDDNDADQGYQWLVDNLGGTWVQTSPDNQDFARVGCAYDPAEQKFIVPGVIVTDSEYDYELPGGDDEQFFPNPDRIVLSKEQEEMIKPLMVLLENPDLTEEERADIQRQMFVTVFPSE